MRLPVVVLGIWAASWSLALADEQTDRRIAESALRELTVLRTEGLRGRLSSERDYGLVRATLKFSTIRNASRSASLSPSVYEGHSCSDWLYLHCGVPTGHVFAGTLEILLAVDQEGAWRAVAPHWRSRRQYSLDGYLLLEGRPKEGYVLSPKPR